ncbi:MAG: hypothetical protein AB1798_06610, partial [Spirochaetota bacterium]
MKSGKYIQEELKKFCKAMQTDDDCRYKYSESTPPTLTASSFAGLTLALIGELDKLGSPLKEKWIGYLQNCQDEKTGLFINPEFKSEDKHSAIHTDELLHAHHSTFVMGLLIRLGTKPLYPIYWAHQYRQPKKMQEWIESLPWDVNAWMVGNWTYDMGCAMGMDYLVTTEGDVLEGMNGYFNWFDKHQLDESGWWDLKKNGSELHHQQYGGYHTLMVYWMFDRPVSMADRIIDSSLSLQAEDGMFDPEGGGGCCQDMDVIDPLVTLGLATGYRQKDIVSALERALPPILAKQNEDGGFYDTTAWERTEFGWDLCKAGCGKSDLCSCLFQGFS